MLATSVKTPEEALAYMLDCTLATVETLAMKKSRTKSEFNRHMSIAQQCLDWAHSMNVDYSHTRGSEVDKFNRSVADWARQYMV
jgi:hypothetical protein